MKKISTHSIALMLILISTFKASAQSEETREVSGFNTISSAGPFNVHVKINGTESLKIIASPDIINDIETVVENGNLKIKFKHHDTWRHHNIGKVDINMTAKSLSALSNAGSGYIKVEGELSADNVDFSISGSGDITSAVKAGNLHIDISGSGSVHINGYSNKTNISILGSGEMSGREFKTSLASVSIAGSGSAYLIAEKNISGSIIGSGNVVYSGNASADVSTIGSGRAHKVD